MPLLDLETTKKEVRKKFAGNTTLVNRINHFLDVQRAVDRWNTAEKNNLPEDEVLVVCSDGLIKRGYLKKNEETDEVYLKTSDGVFTDVIRWSPMPELDKRVRRELRKYKEKHGE